MEKYCLNAILALLNIWCFIIQPRTAEIITNYFYDYWVVKVLLKPVKFIGFYIFQIIPCYIYAQAIMIKRSYSDQ